MTQTTLLLAAMRVELDPVIRLLKLHREDSQRWQGMVAGQRVAAICTGIGPTRMTQQLDAQHEQPQRALLLGFAGSLTSEFAVGEVLQASTVSDVGTNHTIELQSTPTLASPAKLVSVSQLIFEPAAKRILQAHTQADIVDMESYAAAQWAVQQGLPLMVLRAISDGVDDALPVEATQWITQDGKNNPSAALRWLMRHPLKLGVLTGLASRSRKAAHALAKTVQQYVETTK